jgi:ABC-type nitrate/sulfonate/bicarbonate transport system permease component
MTLAQTRTETPVSPRPGRRRSGARVRVVRWGTVLGLLVIWQVVAMLAFHDSLFVATPIDVVTRGWRVFEDEQVVHALGETAIEFVIALAGAAAAGIVLGLVLGATMSGLRIGRDVLQVLFAVPQVAVYPIYILFLGLGTESKIVFGLTHAFFPIVLSTLAGRERVEDTLPRAVRSMGGGPISVAVKAILPSMVPDILTGLRLGASLALLGVLLGELMASSGGIGQQLTLLVGNFQPARLFAVIAAVSIFAVLVNWLLSALHRRATRWAG